MQIFFNPEEFEDKRDLYLCLVDEYKREIELFPRVKVEGKDIKTLADGWITINKEISFFTEECPEYETNPDPFSKVFEKVCTVHGLAIIDHVVIDVDPPITLFYADYLNWSAKSIRFRSSGSD